MPEPTMKEMLMGGLKRMLLCEMPEAMRGEIEALLARADADEYDLKSAYALYAKRLVLARPREEIAWNPTVDEARCVGCETCFDFCPHEVYTMREGKAVVTNPTQCVILCANCMPLCPAQAIAFPPQKDFAALLVYE